ncbi:MFS transporter [Candidatus Entotheonella palauensis]|uniref:MFS transporter n=1 Tax=Candidatus Entotheonella palauensis TaxID=93172 RepID=UPI0015C4E1F6|nr:MFS transporter [Candidatus Entotheonella palauensis]
MPKQRIPDDHDVAETRYLNRIGLLGEGFFSRLSIGIIAFALPLYARQIGLSMAEIGVLVSFNLGISMVLKPFSGWVADRVGYKRSAWMATALRSLLYVLLAGAALPWQLLSLQGARGAVKAVRDPALYTLIAVHGGKKRLASTFSWYMTAKGSAGSIGRALSGVLITLTASNYGWVFGIAAGLSLVSLIFLSFVESKGAEEIEPTCQTNADHHPRHWVSIVPYLGFGFLTTATARLIRGLMPLIMVEYSGLSAAQAGILYVIATLVMLVCTPIFGWLYDHVNRKVVLMARGMANMVSSILYLVAPTFVGFAIAKAFDKAGTAAFQPAWGALMAEVSGQSQHRRAQHMGLMSTGENAGAFAAPMIGGLCWSIGGVAALMGLRIALAIISEVYSYMLFRSRNRSHSA